MDSISTQTGELLHRYDKRRFTRTNGRKYIRQMDKIQRIEARLNDIQDDLTKMAQSTRTKPVLDSTSTSLLVDKDFPAANVCRLPYQVAASQKNPIVLPMWIDSDPGLKNFLPRLKSHLIARLQGGRYEEEINRPASELAQLHFQYDRIYAHQTLKFHYTTYDVRRSKDTINPNTPKRFILVPSDKSVDSEMGADRFWYARVRGIYHANISYCGSRPIRVDCLWVRWLARMTDVPGGWTTCRLDQVGYFPDAECSHAYDFIDPLDVVRAVHLIPRFIGD